MPPFRNPLRFLNDLSHKDGQTEDSARATSNVKPPAFERVDTTGSKASSAGGKPQEIPEYKMSVVNDSGVYLPPSPTEKKSFWPRRGNLSSASVNSSNTEIEAFPISRESFDSYRRSFDISAKSPISATEVHQSRQSLDSARFSRPSRSALHERTFERPPPTSEEFEDVGLNDEKQPKKKMGFFSKFGDDTTETAPNSGGRFHIKGRKRGQSGVGEELGNMQKPGATTGSEAPQDIR